MLHAVIMAGGSGTRFWPASRRSRPKQFLTLATDRPLLRLTADRLRTLVPPERVWVVTAADTVDATRSQLPGLPAANVIAEPEGRDTAACAGLAAHVLLDRDPDATCLLLPADHVIADEAALRRALAAGARVVEREGGLLTFGIEPTAPDTGFGYLRLGPLHGDEDGLPVHRLERFVEKPDAATARRYLDEGGYLWNSGMFAWRATDLLAEIERQLPRLAAGLAKIGAALGTDSERATIESVFPSLPRTSVDYGVMEGASRCWLMPVAFDWSDVGSWPALRDVASADEGGNVVDGRVVTVDARDNVIVSEGPVVAVVGVSNLVVVAVGDAVLVVPADRAQEVKTVVEALQDRGWGDVL
jgi:mannose-1-phosphate guanylyltransferase